MSKQQYYIGVMSGTSADGIDLALVDFSNTTPSLVASDYQPYDDNIREHITSLYTPSSNEIDRAFALDKQLAKLFAQAINAFLTKQSLTADNIIAIGNHGQTVRHRPANKNNLHPFTLQIGCSQTLACLTGIDVIGQFRHKDIALGGQGAPLVPAFHQHIVEHNNTDTFIVNIGGIANITYLPADNTKSVLGFDTGPGNALLDDWYQQHNQGSFDSAGQWAASGTCQQSLLNNLLNEPYFQQTIPKSTGREVFHLQWLKSNLNNYKSATVNNNALAAEDIQATLLELTAVTIANDIKQLSNAGTIYLCGGGTHNNALLQRLNNLLDQFKLAPISDIGIDPDALEAMAFAWLAYAYKKNIPSNMPSVTGASEPRVLGEVFEPE